MTTSNITTKEVLTPASTNELLGTKDGVLARFELSAVKTAMSLDQVNNTSDANKPVSDATQNALDLKADAVDLDEATAPELFDPGFFWFPQQSKSLQPVVGIAPTYTRAANTGTGATNSMYMNSAGLWVTAAVDTPRFHHYYRDGKVVSGGLLMEPARSNNFLQSAACNNAAWTLNNITVAAVASPDGTNNAWQITESTDGAATYHRFYQDVVMPAGPFALSIWYKPIGRSKFRFNCGGPNIFTNSFFDTASMTVTSADFDGYTYKITAEPNGWFRLSCYGTAVGGSGPLQFWTDGSSNGAQDYQGDGRVAGIVWCPQIEFGLGATSPILTTSAAVSRPADSLTITDADFPSSGMVFVKSVASSSTAVADYISINDATANNVLSLGRSASGLNAKMISGGTTNYNDTLVRTFPDLVESTAGVMFDSVHAVSAIDGDQGVEDTSVVFPVGLTRAQVCSNLNGCIQLVRILAETTTNEKFVGMTGATPLRTPDAIATDHITKLIVDGNSLTASSQGATWPYQMAATMLKMPNAVLTNVAVSGQNTTEMNTDRVSQVHPLIVSDQTIIVPWEVSNSIYGTNQTARQIIDALWVYCDAVKALGAKVVIATPTPRSSVATPVDFESRRQSCCTLMRNEWRFHGHAFVDIALDATMGVAGAETNSTYYSDLVHPTTAGQIVLSNLMSVGILTAANYDCYSDYAVLSLTSAKAEMYRDFDFLEYDTSCPGSRFRFNCTYPKVQIVLSSGTPEPVTKQSTCVVLVNGVEYSTATMPASGDLTITVSGSGNRLIEVLPAYARNIDIKGIKTFGSGVITKPSARPTGKLAVIGDSITQSFSASRPTKSWAYLLAELKGLQVLNYGFGSMASSNAADSGLGTIVARQNPSKVIMCMGFNDNTNQQTTVNLKIWFGQVVSQIRAILPTVPIYLGGPWYTSYPAAGPITYAQYRTAIQELVTSLADPNVFWVNTLAATTTNNSTGFPDTIHPVDVTHQEIATYLNGVVS